MGTRGGGGVSERGGVIKAKIVMWVSWTIIYSDWKQLQFGAQEDAQQQTIPSSINFGEKPFQKVNKNLLGMPHLSSTMFFIYNGLPKYVQDEISSSVLEWNICVYWRTLHFKLLVHDSSTPASMNECIDA